MARTGPGPWTELARRAPRASVILREYGVARSLLPWCIDMLMRTTLSTLILTITMGCSAEVELADDVGGEGAEPSNQPTVISCDADATCQRCSDNCELACQPDLDLCEQAVFRTGGWGGEPSQIDDQDAATCAIAALYEAGEETTGTVSWLRDDSGTMGPSSTTTTVHLLPGRRAIVQIRSSKSGGCPGQPCVGEGSSSTLFGPIDIADPSVLEGCLIDTVEPTPASLYACLESSLPSPLCDQ